MRSDAERNRARLLEAAVELILEVGGEPTREAVAARAGVGIGTLYRHFPDQPSLLRAVVHHTLDRSIAAAEAALSDAPDGFTALRRYMHAAVDAGLGVVNLIFPLIDPPHADLRARADSAIRAIIDRGRQEGQLRSDVSPADIALATIRFCRPLAIGWSLDEERALAHRHIDVYLNGLHT